MTDLTHIQAVVAEARTRVERGQVEVVPDGFGASPRKDYLGGEFTWKGERWVVCTAPMISSSFQLLDATVHWRLAKRARHAVALLQARPPKDGHGPEPLEGYLRRYQQVAWSALGVAWILGAGHNKGVFLGDPSGLVPEQDDFTRIRDHVAKALGRLRITNKPKGSREAEEIIRPCVEEALRSVDPAFRPAGRRYRGFWRRPQADGIWRRETGVPAVFGLEVKLHEDMNNPLCQAVELLGEVDAMVYVRVEGSSAKALPTLAKEAKDLLSRNAPIAYLSVPTA